MEGIWRTEKGVGAVLFGIPDETVAANHYEVKIPKLASFYLTHKWDGEVQGLMDFKDSHPPVRPIFFAFRLMVGIGLLMCLVAWWSCWQTRHGRMLKPYLARILVLMSFAGWAAVLAGWYVTEIGRQPYLVYGILKTTDAAAAISQPVLASSLMMYITAYIGLIVAYISTVFYLARKANA
jgi:cytochrome d ubiquinol oxidase subunit I